MFDKLLMVFYDKWLIHVKDQLKILQNYAKIVSKEQTQDEDVAVLILHIGPWLITRCVLNIKPFEKSSNNSNTEWLIVGKKITQLKIQT